MNRATIEDKKNYAKSDIVLIEVLIEVITQGIASIISNMKEL